jgi:hypothetical protein
MASKPSLLLTSVLTPSLDWISAISHSSVIARTAAGGDAEAGTAESLRLHSSFTEAAQTELLEDMHNGSSDSLTGPICTINILLTAATLSSKSSWLMQRGHAEKGQS